MTCRACGGPLLPGAVLRLAGAPRSAQGFLDDPKQAGEVDDLNVRQCSACGLVQLDGEPVPYYRDVITAANWSPEMMSFRRRQARDLVARHRLEGRTVLEVGCASGHFLDLLGEAGAIATGLEHGERAIAEARRHGRRVVEGYVTENPPLAPPYAAFVCINFLEHAPHPAEFLGAMYALLADDAVGLIEVPALDQAIERRRFYDFVRDHLSYFSRETLVRILESNGFDVLGVERVWHGDDLCAIVRKRPRADFRGWVDDNPVVAEFMSLVSDPRFPSVAMWGASHQALTLVAMARPCRVRFIVDSSPGKQGRFEACLGLPVVAPARLRDEPVDLVIVTAAGYSDEVVRQLRSDVGYRGAIAVLRDARFELAGVAAGATC